MIAVLIGPPGAGKSKQSELLKQREHVNWVYVGRLLRDQNDPMINEIMARGDLVDDDLVNSLIEQELNKVSTDKVVVLDGFPRHTPQAAWLINYAARSEHSLKTIIHLLVSPKISRQRLSRRARNDDTAEGIDQRLADYRTNIHPLIDYFASHGIGIEEVDGEQTVEQVFNDIDRILDHVHQG